MKGTQRSDRADPPPGGRMTVLPPRGTAVPQLIPIPPSSRHHGHAKKPASLPRERLEQEYLRQIEEQTDRRKLMQDIVGMSDHLRISYKRVKGTLSHYEQPFVPAPKTVDVVTIVTLEEEAAKELEDATEAAYSPPLRRVYNDEPEPGAESEDSVSTDEDERQKDLGSERARLVASADGREEELAVRIGAAPLDTLIALVKQSMADLQAVQTALGERHTDFDAKNTRRSCRRANWPARRTAALAEAFQGALLSANAALRNFENEAEGRLVELRMQLEHQEAEQTSLRRQLKDWEPVERDAQAEEAVYQALLERDFSVPPHPALSPLEVTLMTGLYYKLEERANSKLATMEQGERDAAKAGQKPKKNGKRGRDTGNRAFVEQQLRVVQEQRKLLRLVCDGDLASIPNATDAIHTAEVLQWATQLFGEEARAIQSDQELQARLCSLLSAPVGVVESFNEILSEYILDDSGTDEPTLLSWFRTAPPIAPEDEEGQRRKSRDTRKADLHQLLNQQILQAIESPFGEEKAELPRLCRSIEGLLAKIFLLSKKYKRTATVSRLRLNSRGSVARMSAASPDGGGGSSGTGSGSQQASRQSSRQQPPPRLLDLEPPAITLVLPTPTNPMQKRSVSFAPRVVASAQAVESAGVSPAETPEPH